jgi:hypothetical protein
MRIMNIRGRDREIRVRRPGFDSRCMTFSFSIFVYSFLILVACYTPVQVSSGVQHPNDKTGVEGENTICCLNAESISCQVSTTQYDARFMGI